jgi:hypothetical protein
LEEMAGRGGDLRVLAREHHLMRSTTASATLLALFRTLAILKRQYLLKLGSPLAVGSSVGVVVSGGAVVEGSAGGDGADGCSTWAGSAGRVLITRDVTRGGMTGGSNGRERTGGGSTLKGRTVAG